MSARILEAREEVGELVSEIGEGPIWDERAGVLRWVDINRGLVHAHDPVSGQLPTLEVGQPVGFVVPHGADQLLAGVRDGFALVDPDGTLQLKHAVERDRPHMRMNDGKADPAGRVWGGTMGIESPGPEGTLYRLDPDWTVTPQLTSLTVPNGIGWSPDGTVMYYTDTSWGRIDAFAYDMATGGLGTRRVYAEIPADAGIPDGLTIDEEGCVWIAVWGAAAVHRYTPEGRLDTVVRVPALQATSCVFGGPGRKDLFITSGRCDLSPRDLADHPRSGRVFTCRPGVAGLPTDSFASV